MCFLSAIHAFARRQGEPCWVTHFEDVVETYGDGWLHFGRQREHRHVDVYDWHRRKDKSEHINYLGTFAKALMPDIELPVDFELPAFDPEEKRCLIQVRSNFAANPDPAYVQRLVDKFMEMTGESLFVIGDENTPRWLERVDYSLVKTSIPTLMRHISNAKCVLTPRSISAHLAAGYKVPALVWLPDDGENWHLDYPDWSHFRIGINGYSEECTSGLEKLCHVL